MRFCKPLILIALLSIVTVTVRATHFYGVDLYYTYINSNTYRVTMVAFGDCSGEQFPSFSNSMPLVHIMQGGNEVGKTYLQQEAPKEGIEVTSGCPADLQRSTCIDPAGTVPGVKKFTYSEIITLSLVTDTRIVYLGETSGPTTAGRSNSVTNLSQPGIITLEAVIKPANNIANSSPQFSTVATQFYCINQPIVFNPGVTDPDGDSLVFELIPAMDGLNLAQYSLGYSGTLPLATTAGTFNFNNKTGTLSFTPNQTQKSIVVYKVSEYRNGTLVGSVTREMTIIVMPCINYPPQGDISSLVGAILVDTTTVQICAGNRDVTFNINPVDPSLQIIDMKVDGLPDGATLDIIDNHTIIPRSKFSWKVPNLPNGDYKFYITYTDDGCPYSQQTQTYTIRIKPDSIWAQAIAAGCSNLGLFEVTAQTGWAPWAFKIYDDLSTVYSIGHLQKDTWSDSLQAGSYRIQAINESGCNATTSVDIPYGCNIADLPAAFSPNGDGKNDMLYVRGTNIQDIQLTIYNRWGQVVFDTQDAKKGWDGTFKGQAAPVEGYAYVLSVVFKGGETFQKQGNITLLR